MLLLKRVFDVGIDPYGQKDGVRRLEGNLESKDPLSSEGPKGDPTHYTEMRHEVSFLPKDGSVVIVLTTKWTYRGCTQRLETHCYHYVNYCRCLCVVNETWVFTRSSE